MLRLVATAYQQENSSREDLSRLSDAERRVLRLLAEGHTAKSIAAALGSTAAAVNERLREARRKTGVGSSRELARLLRAQEARDEQIGVVAAPASDELRHSRPAAGRSWGKGVVAMFGIGIIGAAAAMLLNQPESTEEAQAPAAASQVIDPLLGQAMPSGESSPDRLHARLRSEARNAAWAEGAEKAIRERYSRIAHLGNLRVICAASLCEVAGTIDLPSPSGKPQDSPEARAMNKVLDELQGQALREQLSKSGLKNESSLFTAGSGKPPTAVFFTYYSLEKP